MMSCSEIEFILFFSFPDAEKHITESSGKKASLEKAVGEVETGIKEILSTARG